MLRRVALVSTNVSEELSAFFISVTRIGEVGTTLAVTRNRQTLRRNCNIPEDAILQNLKLIIGTNKLLLIIAIFCISGNCRRT
jgi:hypothetical protein